MSSSTDASQSNEPVAIFKFNIADAEWGKLVEQTDGHFYMRIDRALEIDGAAILGSRTVLTLRHRKLPAFKSRWKLFYNDDLAQNGVINEDGKSKDVNISESGNYELHILNKPIGKTSKQYRRQT